VPLLAHLVPLRYLVPLLSLMDLLAALSVGLRTRRGVRWDELRRVVPFMVVGIVAGLGMLVYAPEKPLLAGLGLFLVAYSAYTLLRRGGPVELSHRWGPPAGFASGAFASMYGNGGLIMALYAGGRLRDKEELRATSAAVVAVNASVRVVLFGALGLLSQDGLLLSAALLVPSLLLGLFLGNRIHTAVSPATVLRAIYLVVAIAGAILLVRSIAA
jgi:uncharacterized membrane protein YfcA